MCAMLLSNMPNFPLYELSCLIFFLVPMLSIAVLYVRMGLRIQSNGLGRSIEGSVHGETKQAQSRKAIIRMLSKFPFFSEYARARGYVDAATLSGESRSYVDTLRSRARTSLPPFISCSSAKLVDR